MKSLALQKPLGFRLQAAAEFYSGFTPCSGMAVAATDQLSFAFGLDQSFTPVAVTLREEPGALLLDVAGTDDLAAVARQIGRMLGFEADPVAWFSLGESDLVVGDLQRQFPGFLTAAKASPYDAATWAVISPRINPAHAARIKLAMSQQLGDAVELRGRTHYVFPSPEVLASLERFPGLPEEKVARLRGVARAALDGRLDAERLRSLGETRALDELQTLRGVGPWAASHIYFRGAAPHDGLPTAEPRILHGLASAYRLRSPTVETFRRIASGWRPFRAWVCVLLMRHLAGTAGWNAPSLSQERARAGRALSNARQHAKPAA